VGKDQADPSSNVDADALSAAVASWLRANLPRSWVAAIDADDPQALAEARATLDLTDWWARLADAGFVTPTWPRRYGGLGLTPVMGALVMRRLREYKVPRFRENAVGVNLVGPAILRWGSDAQKERFLEPIARNREVWCQMISEPGAGSDLASLSTRAVRDGDTWLITGQKVWTSFAHIAVWGLLLARTEPDAPKHRGITAFILRVKQPGVTVRPLRYLTGDAEFNEVFVDNAEIHDELRLGEVNGGWQVTVSVLMNERVGASGIGATLPGAETGRSVQTLIRRHAPMRNPVLRDLLTRLWIESELIRMTNLRAAARRRAGHPPGPEGSITKLLQSHHTQALQNLAVDLEGVGGQAWTVDDRWLQNTVWSFLRVRMKTIGGGTSEIQRTILGERLLGLPKEPQVDRDLAWKDVRRS
jgi:alkylation response protein AidB-like acyl-CoA dehydrogenase